MKPRITIYVSGPEVVIANTDARPLKIKALELEYEITTRSVEPTLPYEEDSSVAPVRVMHEREELNITLDPGGTYRYYFGATEKLKSATVVVGIDDEELRITQRIKRSEEEEERGKE